MLSVSDLVTYVGMVSVVVRPCVLAAVDVQTGEVTPRKLKNTHSASAASLSTVCTVYILHTTQCTLHTHVVYTLSTACTYTYRYNNKRCSIMHQNGCDTPWIWQFFGICFKCFNYHISQTFCVYN